MQISIRNGQVDLSGEPILTDINIEINDGSRLGIVGRNGCGKTTLLRLLSGELRLAKKEGEDDSIFAVSGSPVIGTLSQMTFKDDSVSMVDELRSAYSDILDMKARLDRYEHELETSQSEELINEYTTLLDLFRNAGGFYFEKEYESAIRHFGFTEEEKLRPLSTFSGGQRTKIAFLKLLLSKPDLLLLDEPTNHLDIEAVGWLEEYLKNYKKAFVIVSHDRMFLDRTVETVYEIEYGRTTRYVGNYSEFLKQKKILAEQRAKDYRAQQKEIEHLETLVERFRYKATKAAMAQSKIKQLERMERIDAPERADERTFHADFEPKLRSAKDVLTASELVIGFDKPLTKLNFEIKRGDRIGIVGGNGLGKSTLLKTVMGKIPPLSGRYTLGGAVQTGYFDQQMAQYSGTRTVLDDFLFAYPDYNDFEARSALGAFLFSGEDVFKTLDMLSGGERVRLALCKIFGKKPNFLLLDEPTNHMDIIGKETLEDMLLSYTGTLLFVSHDRYFIKKLADKLLVFENGEAHWYEYGFEQYEAASRAVKTEEVKTDTAEKKEKKSYTTPLKEKAKRERALKKAEELISRLEAEIEALNGELANPENASDYMKLSELQTKLSEKEAELDSAFSEWERLSEEN